MDQLERDAMRVMEILPDVNMADVKISLKVAFPMAEQGEDSNVLTSEMFREENQKKLLTALGVLVPTSSEQPTAEMVDTFNKVVSRYIGVHSQVESKTSSSCFDKGFSSLRLATKGTETSIQSQIENKKEQEDEHEQEDEDGDVRKAISSDSLMRKIRSAKENRGFGEKFQKENPGIQLKDIMADKDKFLVHSPSGKIAVIGKSLQSKVIRIVDDQVCHQGPDETIAALKKGKYIFLSEAGETLNPIEAIADHNCADCKEVEEIKEAVPVTQSGLYKIPQEHLQRVLKYADQKHKGFGEAFRRIKSWCDFGTDYEDMQSQVGQGFITILIVNLAFPQVREYIAKCTECGARTAQLLLSKQQRDALGRQHPFKFIYGKHGSGKVR